MHHAASVVLCRIDVLIPLQKIYFCAAPHHAKEEVRPAAHAAAGRAVLGTRALPLQERAYMQQRGRARVLADVKGAAP